MSPHETIIQYLKIIIALGALTIAVLWGHLILEYLDTLAKLIQINNAALILYIK